MSFLEPDYIFTDGFDKYIQARGTAHSSSDAVQFLRRGEWTDVAAEGIGGGRQYYFTDSLSAGGGGPATEGNSLAIYADTSGADIAATLYKTLPGTFLRCVGGVTIKCALDSNPGVMFRVGGSNVLALAIQEVTGRLILRRGNTMNSTIIATSAESVSANSTNCIEWDIELRAGATGNYKVWLNGILTSLDATGVDTSASATDGFDAIALSNGVTQGGDTAYFDHLYFWLYTDAGEANVQPALTNPVIETQWPVEDVSVSFDIGPGTIGNTMRTLASTAAVGANLYLRPFTVEDDCTLESVSILPGTTSVTAKYKPLVYMDDGSGGAGVPGAPAALIDSGPEVIGSTNGTILNLPLTTPQALTAGQIIWMGWFGDTNITAYRDLSLTDGIRDAVTYASGAPNPPTTITTLQPNFHLYGLVSDCATHWPQVNQITPSTQSYNLDTDVGAKDLFLFEPLSVTPTDIYCISVKTACLRTDAGARTISCKTLSDGIETDGTANAVAPPLTVSYVSSYWWEDPATNDAWAPSAVNDAAGGYEIIT